MRDEGRYLDGRKIKYPPKIFIGSAASPFASEPKFQAIREEKKINAGAQFFQTNLVYDPDGLEVWLNELAKAKCPRQGLYPDRHYPAEEPEDGPVYA